MATVSLIIEIFSVMIPYGIIFFSIDWIYGKVISAFTGRGL